MQTTLDGPRATGTHFMENDSLGPHFVDHGQRLERYLRLEGMGDKGLSEITSFLLTPEGVIGLMFFHDGLRVVFGYAGSTLLVQTYEVPIVGEPVLLDGVGTLRLTDEKLFERCEANLKAIDHTFTYNVAPAQNLVMSVWTFHADDARPYQIGFMSGSDPAGDQVVVLPPHGEDHPHSVAMRESVAQRQTHVYTDLDAKRRIRAGQRYSDFDFEAEVEGSDPWEIEDDTWSRRVYLGNSGEEPRKARFYVTFTADSDAVEDTTLL